MCWQKNWIGSKKFQVFVKRTKSDRACRKIHLYALFFMFFSRKKSKSRKKGEKIEDTMFLQFSGESKNIEYKVSLFDKSEKYMKTIVAFANIFSQMGLVEAWGSGIKRIFNAAEEYGLPKPRFQEFDNMFRVELFRSSFPMTNEKENIGEASEEHRR